MLKKINFNSEIEIIIEDEFKYDIHYQNEEGEIVDIENIPLVFFTCDTLIS